MFINCCHTPSRQGDKITNVRLDLTDEKAVAKSLKDNQVEGVTHVFHTAFSGADPHFTLGFSSARQHAACSTHFALMYVSHALLQLRRCKVAASGALNDRHTNWLCVDHAGDMTNMSLSVANMLRNIVEALEETKAPLQHVYTTLGGEADRRLRAQWALQ